MMVAKKSCFLLRIAGVLSALLIPALQIDASSIKPRPTPTPTHHVTVISAVTASSITVETQIVADKSGKVLDKTSRTYGVSNFTEITLNGQRATLANLKPGMKVSVTIGTDPSKAARILANG
jgi:hypothetical protein